MKRRLAICVLAALWLGGAQVYGEEYVEDSRTVIYRQVEGASRIPEELSVDGGETYRLEEREIFDERWEDGFSFPVIFRNYGADVYYLNGTAVKSGEEPFQEECGDLLLGAIGQSRENYLVEGVAWDGESYVDESGVPCRRALAVGKKRVWSERTVYWGRRLAQEEPETEAQVIVLGSPMEDIFLPAEAAGEEGEKLALLVRAAVAVLSLGILLLLAAGAVCWVRERKREKEKRRGREA